jgi:hypothetical protein
MVMKKVYYIKQGRRYVPVAEYDQDLMSSFPKGAHIVMSYPGGQSTRYNINPDYAAMIAAGRIAEDAIAKAIYAESEARPKQRPITKRQKAAWEEMKAAFGDELFSLNFSSARDLAEVGVRAMQAEADKLMQHEGVRKSYDNFILMCQLVKDQNDT